MVTVATAGEVIGAAVPALAFGRSTAGEWTAERVGFTLVGVTTPVSTALQVEDVSIDDLRPDHANPRLIGDGELDALERSLRQFGFVQPVLARREDSTVIGGHQRLVTARRLGLTTVPMDRLDVSVEHAPLWYLALLRVDPSQQGLGLGSRLLETGLRTADADHLPAYLETPNPHAVAFYERQGFVVSGRAQAGTCPPIVSMVRKAR